MPLQPLARDMVVHTPHERYERETTRCPCNRNGAPATVGEGRVRPHAGVPLHPIESAAPLQPLRGMSSPHAGVPLQPPGLCGAPATAAWDVEAPTSSSRWGPDPIRRRPASHLVQELEEDVTEVTQLTSMMWPAKSMKVAAPTPRSIRITNSSFLSARGSRSHESNCSSSRRGLSVRRR